MILVFLDQADGEIKKSSLEAAAYAAGVAKMMNTTAEALILGPTKFNLSTLGNYGITKVHAASSEVLTAFDSQVYTTAIQQAVEKSGAEIIILSNNSSAKAIAPRLSIRLKAGLVMGAVALPDTSNGFIIKKNVFSGKAFAHVKVETTKKIIALEQNAFHVTKTEGTASIEPFEPTVPASKIKVLSSNKTTGEVLLSEASIVISGGRGLKGPENWHLVTDLASLLGAATACSRPVADVGWRPHKEHVGQTGLAIAPNLYFAIGISGAIQHLAGVNRSKVIVVINKDPEAPFFKAADYGIVSDLFEVMPKIIAAVKKLKDVA